MQFWSDAFGCQSVFQFVTCSGCFLQRLPSFLRQTKWSKVLTCVMSRMRRRRKKANCLKSRGRFVYSHSFPRASCLYDFLSVSSASLLSVALSFSHICVAVSHVSQPSSSSSPVPSPRADCCGAMGRGHDVTSSDSSARGMRRSEQAEARASLLNRPDLPGNIHNQNSVAFPPWVSKKWRHQSVTVLGPWPEISWLTWWQVSW